MSAPHHNPSGKRWKLKERGAKRLVPQSSCGRGMMVAKHPVVLAFTIGASCEVLRFWAPSSTQLHTQNAMGRWNICYDKTFLLPTHEMPFYDFRGWNAISFHVHAFFTPRIGFHSGTDRGRFRCAWEGLFRHRCRCGRADDLSHSYGGHQGCCCQRAPCWQGKILRHFVDPFSRDAKKPSQNRLLWL